MYAYVVLLYLCVVFGVYYDVLLVMWQLCLAVVCVILAGHLVWWLCW